MPTDPSRVAEIRCNLEACETEDLLEIWHSQNDEEWTEEAFEAIRQILTRRLGELPSPQPGGAAADVLDSPQVIAQAIPLLRKSNRHLEAGRTDQALQDCIVALRLAPNLPVAYNQLGLVYDALERLDEAIAAYREALRLAPDYEEARANLRDAEIEWELEKQQAPAQDHLDQAIELVDNDELEQALEECDRTIEAAPHLAVAHNYRGMILEELERLPEAIDAYHRAFEIHPQFYAARENYCCARIRYIETLYSQSPYESEEEEAEARLSFEQAEFEFEELQDDDLFDENAPESLLPSVDEVLEIPALYLDELAILLTGWPGHRIRPGRSGYDPLDSYFEEGHMEGVFVRSIFTGSFLTNNPIYLLGMLFCGLILLIPMVFLFGDLSIPTEVPILVRGYLMIVIILSTLTSLCLLANIAFSLAALNDDEQEFITGP